MNSEFSKKKTTGMFDEYMQKWMITFLKSSDMFVSLFKLELPLIKFSFKFVFVTFVIDNQIFWPAIMI